MVFLLLTVWKLERIGRTDSGVGAKFLNWWNAITLFNAPSSSRTLLCTEVAMQWVDSWSSRNAFSRHLVWRIATRVSKSGFPTSAIMPHSKRETRRASRAGIAFGGRSDVI